MAPPVRQEMKDRHQILWIVLGAVGVAGLLFAGRDHYLLLSIIFGFLGAAAAWAVFIVVSNTRAIEENSYFIILGIAFLFVGLLDLTAVLASKGMNVIPGYGKNTAAQLAVAARCLQAVTLFTAPFFAAKKIRIRTVSLIGIAVTTALLGSIFVWNIFPACYDSAGAPTPFMTAAGWVIPLSFLVSILPTTRVARLFDRRTLRYLTLSPVAAAASTLPTAFALPPRGFADVFCRLFLVVSFYLVYRAAVRTTLRGPYAALIASLRQNRETQRALLNAAGNRAILISTTGEILALNDGAAADFDAPASDLIGGDLYSRLAPGPSRAIKGAVETVVESAQPKRFEEDMGGRCFDIGVYPVLDPEGAVAQLAVYSEEITERKKMERELVRLSITDNLTGLFNQRHFVKRIKEEVDRAHRAHCPLCLVIFDVDDFKRYNDLHGHLKGDQILRTIGTITLSSIRNGVDGAFRYGGDEFALILPYADPVIAENIIKRISIKVAEKTRGVTITYGISDLRDDVSVAGLITSADDRMYDKKNRIRQKKVVG